jgi:hypothetical protein
VEGYIPQMTPRYNLRPPILLGNPTPSNHQPNGNLPALITHIIPLLNFISHPMIHITIPMQRLRFPTGPNLDRHSGRYIWFRHGLLARVAPPECAPRREELGAEGLEEWVHCLGAGVGWACADEAVDAFCFFYGSMVLVYST